ncbi:hypothetical protein D3C76_309360 [compost metagenome]
MGRILVQVANVDALPCQGFGHKAAEGIGADPADKGRFTAEPRHPHRHVGGRTARTFEVVLLPFRN